MQNSSTQEKKNTFYETEDYKDFFFSITMNFFNVYTVLCVIYTGINFNVYFYV